MENTKKTQVQGQNEKTNQERTMNERTMNQKADHGRVMAGEEGRAAGHSATHKANENRTASKGHAAPHGETAKQATNQERAAHGKGDKSSHTGGKL